MWLHGRGYTCSSMREHAAQVPTPHRGQVHGDGRRHGHAGRPLVDQLSSASLSRRYSGMDVPRCLELLALDPSGGQRDQRGDARVRRTPDRPARRGRARRTLARGAATPSPTRSDLLAARLRARPRARAAAHRVLARPAARRRAPAGTTSGTPLARRASSTATTRRFECRTGYATRSRLGTATTGMRSACAITFAVVTPTRSPVNEPGPDADRDRGELIEAHAGPLDERLDRRRELLRVASTADESDLAADLAGVADGHADLRRSRCRSRGSAPTATSSPAPSPERALERGFTCRHRGPHGVIVMTRSSSIVPSVSTGSSRISRRSAGR